MAEVLARAGLQAGMEGVKAVAPKIMAGLGTTAAMIGAGKLSDRFLGGKGKEYITADNVRGLYEDPNKMLAKAQEVGTKRVTDKLQGYQDNFNAEVDRITSPPKKGRKYRD